MIVLDYELSPSWSRKTEAVDLRAAGEMALRYECFLGDIVFVVRGVDMSARWGWVPVLDFALGLRSIAGGLVGDEQQIFEFTESDATITFLRNADAVSVTANYAAGAVAVPLVQFSLAVDQFLARTLEKLCCKHHELVENEFVKQLSRTLVLPA